MSAQRRAEGFSGQHLVVVPRPAVAAAARHPLLRGLRVTDAGYFPRAAGHQVVRENGINTHLVIVCLEGTGWVRSKSSTRIVRPGDLVWLRAHEPHSYGASETTPWTIGWVHFAGDEAEAWSRLVGFSPDPIALLSHASAEGVAALKIEQIYLQLERGYAVPDLITAAQMLRSAFNLAAEAVRSSDSSHSAMTRVMAVRDHLRESFAQSHTLASLAAGAGLSIPHFCALFRRTTGYAPIDFIIRQRVQAACRLLDTTDQPIGSIAEVVGYEDPYYFTRCFRRVTGVSPRAYRHIQKG